MGQKYDYKTGKMVWDGQGEQPLNLDLFGENNLNASLDTSLANTSVGNIPSQSYADALPKQQPDTFMGMTNTDISGISALGGLASTGYDLYSNIWGGGKEARDAQIRNANAQAKYNEAATKHTADFYDSVAKSGLSG